MNQDLWLRFTAKKESLSGGNALLPILRMIDAKNYFQPTILEATGKQDKEITGFLDPKVLKALDKKKHSVQLKINSDLFSLGIYYHDDLIVVLRIAESSLKQIATTEIVDLFLNLSHLIKPIYSESHFVDHMRMMNDNYYSKNRRTYYCRGLSWLNFFSTEEEERQGGNLDKNPLITRSERFPEGLFIQVGDNPFDLLRPEGEELLVKATQAMSAAVRWSDTVIE